MSQQTPSEIHLLIEEGQALVRSLALRIFRKLPVRVDLDDLIAYGEVGLAEAARDFDPAKGNRFSTFAYYRIRGAIYDGLAKMTWTSRARYRRLRFEQMANQVIESEKEQDSGSALDAAASGQWFARVTERLAVVYLASGGDDELTIEDPHETAPQAFIHREVNQKLKTLIDKLPNNEAQLIRAVYYEGRTLQDAASQIGVSKSWASRLHAQILERLADEMRKLDLHD